MSSDSSILPGCSVLPPLESDAPPTHDKKTRTKPRVSTDRFTTLNNFVDFTLRDLCRADVVTWFILFRDAREGVAQTSQREIAERGGLRVQHVNKAVKRLASAGLLTIVRQGGFRQGATSYRLSPLRPCSP